MAVVYGVIASSEDEARRALQQLCDLFGLEWVTAPTQLPGQEKWLGRVETPEVAAVRVLPSVAS